MCELQVVKLANLHPRMERNVLLGWLKQDVDHVSKGEPPHPVETRKGVFEVCSEFIATIQRARVAQPVRNTCSPRL